jgi:hypothetical protein
VARILIQNEWYDELSPTALYESNFENIIVDQGPSIFPNHFVVPFKTKIYTDEDVVIPDLALIDMEYRCWWVVEVEMNYHSLDNHILPQVSKLYRGNYGIEQSEYLCSKSQELNKAKIVDMMKGKHPQVLVVVNKPMPEWSRILTRFDARVCVIEVFRSNLNRHVFRLNGEYPSIVSDYITDCSFDPVIPRFMIVESPARLNINHGEKIKISYESCVTEWERIDGQDRVWLSPVNLNPLPKKKRFTILQQNDGSLFITEKN